MPRTTSRLLPGTALAGAVALALAACSAGSSAQEPAATSSAAAVDPSSAAYLADACPAPVTFLTDWMPQSEHGELYQLLGDDATIDDGTKRISGTLVDTDGKDTGVDVEIRAGGPAIGSAQAAGDAAPSRQPTRITPACAAVTAVGMGTTVTAEHNGYRTRKTAQTS